MNPLPPLPLVDGAFLIDNSSLEHFQACRRMYELSDIRRYRLAVPAAGRNFGSCLHVGWKERYTLCGNAAPTDAQVAVINDVMSNYMTANPQPPDDFRTAEHAHKVMAGYNALYKNEPFEILTTPDGTKLVERSFSLELGTVQNVPVIYTGRIDLVVKNNDGIWTLDHKTTFQFGQGFDDEMTINGGQVGYVWAMRQVTKLPIFGYIINGVRIRKPSKSAKYEGVAPVDNEDFRRTPMYISVESIDEWRNDVLTLISDLFFNHDRGFFPKSRKGCVTKYGRCEFFDCCMAPPSSRQSILDSSRYEPNTWSPLNQPNQTTESE